MDSIDTVLLPTYTLAGVLHDSLYTSMNSVDTMPVPEALFGSLFCAGILGVTFSRDYENRSAAGMTGKLGIAYLFGVAVTESIRYFT